MGVGCVKGDRDGEGQAERMTTAVVVDPRTPSIRVVGRGLYALVLDVPVSRGAPRDPSRDVPILGNCRGEGTLLEQGPV